jgi:hypothetical protein
MGSDEPQRGLRTTSEPPIWIKDQFRLSCAEETLVGHQFGLWPILARLSPSIPPEQSSGVFCGLCPLVGWARFIGPLWVILL